MYIDLISYFLIWQSLLRIGREASLPYKIHCNSNGGTWYHNVKCFRIETMTGSFQITLTTSYLKLWKTARIAKLLNQIEITREAWAKDLIVNEDADASLAKDKRWIFNTFGAFLLNASSMSE